VEVRLTSAQAATLGNLWQLHSGALHTMLAGWCGDAQMASDVLQEVFRRLAGSPALMVQMKNARAFLVVSARRIAVDFARRSATRSAYHTAAGAEAPSAENPGPTDAALREAIAKALESLPAEQRVAFEHKVLNGRTLDEISKLEKISLNTAASRLRYALDKIRGQLRPYYDDLKRKDFKNMKNNPSKTEDIASQRIITPLAPKRVPSVAPGLEGLAAMAPDACEAAPEIAAFEPDFVEALPAAELVEPAIFNCGVGGNAWEQFAAPVAFELPAEDGDVAPSEENVGEDLSDAGAIPEMVTCEMFPTDGEIPEEWLKPIWIGEWPVDFLVNVFEGNGDTVADNSAGGEVGDGDFVPFDMESCFEISLLPDRPHPLMPEESAMDVDPNELLARYEEFLNQDPTWLPGLAENQGDWFHEQVTTASGYFEKLEFGTPGEANAFDHWFASSLAAANTTGEEGADYDGEQPDYADDSWSFDPKDLLVRYEDFLRENPDWGALDPDTMEIQVVASSSYFGELEFGTPSKAAAFDSWYEAMYAQGDSNGVGPVDGSGLVLDGSSDFDGGTVVTGGVIVDGSHPDGSGLTEGTSLVLSGGGSFTGGTILSGGVLTTGDADTHHPDGVKGTGSLVLDGRNTFGEIQPHWRGNGGAPEFAYSSAPGGAGLVLNGSAENFALSGDNSALSNGTPRFEETTVVTGGKLELGDDVTVNKAENNTLTLSNGATVVLQGGEVVSGENVYAYNPEFGSVSLPSSDAQLGAVDLPTEIAITGGAVAEAALPFGNVAAGLAPTPIQALIVEFGVLSPSEPLQASQMQAASHASNDLPQSVVASSGGSAGTSGADAALSAAPDDATLDNALPHVAASAQESELASNAGIKVDAPTAAAGAVAVGTVVHGGAAAPALRRPLLTL